MRRLAIGLVAAVMLAGGARAAASDYGNLLGIESQFVCVSCHEPLDQVNSPQAISEKQYLQGLLARHLTMRAVKSAMVSQYGVAVLARPPASGFNLTVYILPPAVVVGGLLLLAFTLPKWRERSRRAALTPLPESEALEPDEARRLRDELDRFI